MKKPGAGRASSLGPADRVGLRRAYLEPDDFFEEPPLDDELDLRPDDFVADFFAPPLDFEELARDEVDFLAPPDFEEPDRDDDFDEDFLLVVAICGVLSFPSGGHGNRISRRAEETTKRPLQSNNTQTVIKFIHRLFSSRAPKLLGSPRARSRSSRCAHGRQGR